MECGNVVGVMVGGLLMITGVASCGGDPGGGQGFFRWLLTKGDVTKVLDPILHYLHEGRKDISTRASSPSHKRKGVSPP